ncbi:MAG TPA: GNAT family N-acetyltransferase [Bryobacteraceae bacterium]
MTDLALPYTAPRLLSRNDLPALLKLKQAAGWNQTAADWERVLRLEPEGCFGVDVEGALAASATAVCYGADLAWIGMVLTHPEFRGRGLARRLMQQSIEFCARRGVRWAKLDATDMGAPIYERLGFRTECAVERRLREPGPAAGGAAPAFEGLPAELDRRAFGADRTALLGDLAREGAASIRGEAFGMGRHGSQAAYFGPCVSESAQKARRMLLWFLEAHPAEPVFWDLLPDNASAVALADEFGFRPMRRLARMSLAIEPGAAPIGTSSALVFAIAGFEYG